MPEAATSTILVVDDTRPNVLLLTTHLRNAGYRTQEATCGEDALLMVETEPPDLILLDVMMPGMDGFEVVQRLKGDERTRNIPVVMVTALTDQESRLRALENGAEEFITKPVHKAELLIRVRNLLKLKKFQDSLAQQSVALEQAVADRTLRLEAANMQLSETQDKLVQSERLASIGQLAAGVAHEINNPIGFVNSNLGSLRSYVEDFLNLLHRYEEAEPLLPAATAQAIRKFKEEIDFGYVVGDVKSLLEESQSGLVRVRDIIQDLKNFARTDTTRNWERGSVERCIESALTIVFNEIKYKADVEKDYGQVPEIDCMPSQLSQVFLNMLVNAAHAVDPARGRGTITVRTRHDADAVWVEIADNGCGIPADNLKRIFDPFFTTKPVGVGTGLGLSVSHGIVHRHGGRIEVESEVGVGTTFRVVLPRTQAPLA